MKKLFVLSLVLTAIVSFAQETYTLDSDEKKGQIILENGTVLEGYVKLKGNERNPWGNQESVEFFTEAAMADGKVKKKERTKYVPKKIKGYTVEGRYFESMKVSLGKLRLGVGIAKWFFVERLAEGDMKMYCLYDSPDPMSVNVGEEAIVAYEQEVEKMRTNPNILLQKGEEDLVLLDKIDFGQYLSGCKSVQEQYKSGGYGFEPFHQDAESKLGKLISRSANLESIVAVLPQIISDYNNCTP